LSAQELAILNEYRPHYEQLKNFYDNIKMEAVYQKSVPTQAQNRASHLVYRARAGKFYRLDETALDAVEKMPDGGVKILLVRPEGHLVAVREKAGAAVVRSWSPDRERGVGRLAGHMFQWSPYSVEVFSMEWMLFRQPGFATTYQVESVNTHVDRGERLVTVTTRAVMKLNGDVWLGHFVFHRDAGWALKEYSWGDADPSKPDSVLLQGRYTYGELRDGVPVLKRLDLYEDKGPDRIRAVEQVFEVKSVEIGPVAEDEFSLDALGIKIGRERSPWLLRLVALGTGVFLLTLYFLLRRRERLRRSGHVASAER
jgi:hypothetical protein